LEQIPHYTTHSQYFDAKGSEVKPEKSEVTHFGSSCQISESLVNRIAILQKEKSSMTPEAWEKFKAERVKTFEDENSVKMDRCKLKKRLRAQVAREKRAAKVQELIDMLP
jgi:hypothetical protein